MSLEPMYPAVNNSVPTALTQMISATQTTVQVDTPAVLPAGPNVATLGTEDNAELLYYAAIEGNTLTGCIRGFGGTLKQIWPEGTAVFRAYTSVDHAAFVQNIKALESEKLSANGDVSAAKVTFSQALIMANLKSGDTLKTIMGKLMRMYNTFGNAAWAAIGTGASNVAAGNHTHDAYVPLAAGKAQADALTAKNVAVTASRTLTPADAGCCLNAASSAQITLTLPREAAAAFPVDTEIEIAREGVGAVKILPQSGVSLQSVRGDMALGVELAARYATVVLKKKGADDWRVMGEMA